jgi:two-component system sensor histidine kinase/response regulator
MENIDGKLIIVIDDDPVMRLSCTKILENGVHCETYEDGEKGLQRIEEARPDLIVVDLKMPKIGGIDVIQKVHQFDPDICIIVITGYATVETAVDAMKAGAYDFLPKPFTPDELRLMVKRGLERTDLLRQSQKLKEEKEQLQRQFVTFVSHQLKSPLAAVQQYLDVLNHLEESPKKEALQRDWITRSSGRIQEMIAIINDWLTLAKLECLELSPDSPAVNINETTNQIFATVREEAEKNCISLINEIPANLNLRIPEKCLTVIFSNLISNAVKYNKPDGKVIISHEDNNENILISVSDTGIGIPEDKREMIFEDFYRIKDERSKAIPGTGLGLSICKKIVTELCGQITVSSNEAGGSTFTVILPKKQVQ